MLSTKGSDDEQSRLKIICSARWLPQVRSATDKPRCRDFQVLLVDSGSLDRKCDIDEARRAQHAFAIRHFTFWHSLIARRPGGATDLDARFPSTRSFVLFARRCPVRWE